MILSKLGIGIGARLVERWAARKIRDNEMKQKGRAEVFALWRSGVSLQQAMRKLRQ